MSKSAERSSPSCDGASTVGSVAEQHPEGHEQTTLDFKTCKPAGANVPLLRWEKGTKEIIVLAVSSRERSSGCQARIAQVLDLCAMEIRAEEPLQLSPPIC
jgi:hypothetical protein